MLDSNPPVLVALALSAAPGARATEPARTGSPASASGSSSSGASSAGSSADSAIGTTSPASSALSAAASPHSAVAAGLEPSAALQVAFAPISLHELPPPHPSVDLCEQLINNLDEDLAKLASRLGPHALLVASTEDMRQVLHPMAAINATRAFNVGEVMDSTLRARLPALFGQFVAVDSVGGIKCSMEELNQKSANERCEIIAQLVMEKGLDLLNHVETINEGYTPFASFDRQVDSSLVVRTRGLPWQASDQDIALFFAGLNIAPGGIALCLSNEGRRNGESLVCFECAAHRELAIRRHRRFLHNRYIEVYRSTGAEFLEVAVGTDSDTLRFVGRDAAMIVRMRGLPFECTEDDIRSFFAADGEPGIMEEGVMLVNKPDGRPTGDAFVLFESDQAGRRALAKHKNRIGQRYIELFRTTQAEVQQIISRVQLKAQSTSLPAAGPITTPSRLFPVGPKRDCLRMRGLPYEAKPEQIANFLGPYAKNIVDKGIHMILNIQGTPSGEAFIQMKTEGAAALAAMTMHNKNMELGKKKRYIEVFQCSVDELQSVLSPGMGGGAGAAAALGQLNPALGLGPPGGQFVALPAGLLAAAGTSQPQASAPLPLPHHQFGAANNYQRLCQGLVGHHHPQPPLAFHPHPMALSQLLPGQLNLLGQFGSQLPLAPGLYAGGDQLYTAATHLQQQQLNAFFDPAQQGFGAICFPPLDIATAASLLHQQNLLQNGALPLKEPVFVSLTDLKGLEQSGGRGQGVQHC